MEKSKRFVCFGHVDQHLRSLPPANPSRLHQYFESKTMSSLQGNQNGTEKSAQKEVNSNHSIFSELVKVLVYVTLLREISMAEEDELQRYWRYLLTVFTSSFSRQSREILPTSLLRLSSSPPPPSLRTLDVGLRDPKCSAPRPSSRILRSEAYWCYSYSLSAYEPNCISPDLLASASRNLSTLSWVNFSFLRGLTATAQLD